MDILIKGGRLLDPANDRDGLFDIRIRDGKILKVMEPSTEKEEPDASAEDCRVVDASGCYVMPGLIDLHVHLRDPGFTYKETVDSGAEAAVEARRRLESRGMLCGRSGGTDKYYVSDTVDGFAELGSVFLDKHI